MIIFYPCGTELAFPLAGFTSLALGSVDRSFKSALSDTVTDFIFVLPEHVPKRTTAAPVAIAYQLIDLWLIQRQVHHGIFICLFNNFKDFIQAYSSSRPSVDVIFCSSAHIDAHLNRNGALPLSVWIRAGMGCLFLVRLLIQCIPSPIFCYPFPFRYTRPCIWKGGPRPRCIFRQTGLSLKRSEAMKRLWVRTVFERWPGHFPTSSASPGSPDRTFNRLTCTHTAGHVSGTYSPPSCRKTISKPGGGTGKALQRYLWEVLPCVSRENRDFT